jgi:putative ABC transport system permease protein
VPRLKSVTYVVGLNCYLCPRTVPPVTALLLAVIGLYGVMAYSVAQRTQEIGIVCGVAGAYASTQLLESLLVNVSATDAVTFVLAPLLFILVALLASLIPTLRAARIDPVGALRV